MRPWTNTIGAGARRRAVSAGLAAEAGAWMAADPDPSTRAELAALVEAGDGAEVRDRFQSPLKFGPQGFGGSSVLARRG